LILGFSKTGRIVEHFTAIENLIAESQPPKSFVFPISDAYRYIYLEPAKDPTVNHGKETYYGQDFYIRNERLRVDLEFCRERGESPHGDHPAQQRAGDRRCLRRRNAAKMAPFCEASSCARPDAPSPEAAVCE
jgi:hypothetical protein